MMQMHIWAGSLSVLIAVLFAVSITTPIPHTARILTTNERETLIEMTPYPTSVLIGQGDRSQIVGNATMARMFLYGPCVYAIIDGVRIGRQCIWLSPVIIAAEAS